MVRPVPDSFCRPVGNGEERHASNPSTITPFEYAEYASVDFPGLLVSGSDDYGTYRTQFDQAARTLIANGTCTEDDFNEMGGWMASTRQGKGKYFTYCGGMSVQNRVYLDVKTGKTGK